MDELDYIEESGTIRLAMNATLTDIDVNFNLSRIEISSTPPCFTSMNGCQLSVANTHINFTSQVNNGVLSITNAGTSANYESLLRSVLLEFKLSELSQLIYTFNVKVFDSNDTSELGCTTIFGSFEVSDLIVVNFIPVNDNSPILDLNGPEAGRDFATTYIEESNSVSIVSTQLTLTDGDLPIPAMGYNFLIRVQVVNNII